MLYSQKHRIIFITSLVVSLKTLPLAAAVYQDDLNTRASEVVKTVIQPLLFSHVEFEKLTQSQQKNIADSWGVSTDEYHQYLNLMQTSSAGKWYQKLDPAEVLGINAKTEAERMHYANIVAKNNYERTSRELAMQQAYDKAFRLLYPNEKAIGYPNKNLNSESVLFLHDGDVILLFTDLNNVSDNSIIATLLKKLESHIKMRINIYILGNKISDEAIRRWASSRQIPVSIVQQGIVTLNRDDGHYLMLAEGRQSLPLAILQRDGQYKRIEFNSL